MFLKLYLITLPIFLAIDMFWLGIIAKNFYNKQIGILFKDNINWVAVAIFYLIFTVGIVTFVILPAVKNSSWIQAILLGALFGLVAYGTYDLTNLATLKNWPILVTIVDLIWGAVLGGVVSFLVYLISIKINLK